MYFPSVCWEVLENLNMSKPKPGIRSGAILVTEVSEARVEKLFKITRELQFWLDQNISLL